MFKRINFVFLLIVFVSSLCYSNQNGPYIKISGVVKDKSTKEVIDNASVIIYGTTQGETTNMLGEFTLNVKYGDIISVSFLGYKTKTLFVDKDIPSKVVFELENEDYALNEVVIKPKRERYKRKNNPAVEFAENIIARKKQGIPYDKDFYSYQKYEKMTFSLNNFDSIRLNKKFYRKFNFLKDYIETSEVTNKPVLTVSTRESIENNYYSKEKDLKKTYVDAYKRDGLDEMIPEDNMNAILGEFMGEIDIFQNEILLLTNKFISPLSNIAPSFYKFYLLDTVYIDGVKHQDLGFVPQNSESFGFTGHLYVTLDSTYFITKVVLNTAQDINLNFVNTLIINQEFTRSEDSIRLKMKDDIIAEFSVFKNVEGLLCKKQTSYSNHRFDKPEDMAIFNQSKDVIVNPEARFRTEDYWRRERHLEINEKENSVSNLLTELRSIPIFYYTEKGISWIVDGYIPTANDSSKFDIGPINTMYSYNTFEGNRIRVGGFTTANMSPHWFFRGYGAYGTKDEKFKYSGEVEYSFLKKNTHSNEFPVHSIKALYKYDIDQLGQSYMTNADNIVLSLKRKSDNRVTYLRNAEIVYRREHLSGLSYILAARYQTNYSTYCVPFDRLNKNGEKEFVPHYNMAMAELKLRYAPKERYYQMKARRINLAPTVPIFTLSHIYGQKDVLGSDFSINRTNFTFDKRQWLSFMGYMDMQLQASKIWNKAPFPMLAIMNANLSYTIQPGTYSLLNPVEFINDEYISWDISYFPNGLIFNRIPFLKLLKWREVTTFKGFIGALSDKNIPNADNGLFVFPEESFKMGKKPYMECSVGIENIFKLLRVDYVWRLSYLNHPNIDKSGVRVSMHITF